MTLTEKKSFGNSSLKLEEYEVGTHYAITINPPDKRLYLKSHHQLDYGLGKEINAHLEWVSLCEGVQFQLYPELSPTGRLHYHGTILMKNIMIFMTHDIKIIDNHCQYCIKHIDDTDEWIQYITKQAPLMEVVIENHTLHEYPITIGAPLAEP